MRTLRLYCALLIVAGLLLPAPSLGQDPESEEPATEEPQPSAVTEEVTVRLIQVPIIARNRNGNPITDLTAEEIRVKDRGKQMKIAFLEPLVEEKIDTPLPKTRLFIDAPGGWEAVSESSTEEPRYVAFLIDVENSPALRKDEAMNDTIRFIRERVTPGSRVAVFSYTGEIHQELLFATDPDAVVTAVMSAYNRSGRPDVDLRARIRDLVRTMSDCVGELGAFVNTANEMCMKDAAMLYASERRPRAVAYMDALDGLVRVMGGLQGRKVVFALSHGVAVDPTMEVAESMRAVIGNSQQVYEIVQYMGPDEGAGLEMDRVIDLAMRKGVTFHFIDRMQAPSWDTSASQMEAFRPGARPAQAAYTAAQMDLEEIAANTGGVFVADTNVFEGLGSAMDLEAGAYLLGYYVDRYLSLKHMRKVSVSSSRKGVRIAHRRGMYDQPNVSDVVGAVRVGAITAAKAGSREENETSRNSFIPFQIVADPRGLQYEEVGQGVHASFTLHVQIQDTEGRVVADGFRFLNHAYPLSVWEAGEAEPILINGWAELPPGRYFLNSAIHNPVNGRQGELSKIIEVPEPQPAVPAVETEEAPQPPAEAGG